MKTTIAALIFLISLPTNAQKLLADKLSHPESVVSDDKFIYVTEIGKALAATERDGDGVVYKFDLKGNAVDLHFNKVLLNAPKGITLLGDNLYLTDIDKIVILNKNTGRKVDDIDLSAYQTSFLNDIEVKNNTTVFVSATDKGQIFEVSVTKPYPVKVLHLPPLKGPNGLCYDREKNKLYVAGLEWGDTAGGEIGVIQWAGDQCTYEKLLEAKGYYDGLQMPDGHTLLVSDWVSLKEMKATVLKVDLDQKTYTPLFKEADAADIFYDKNRNRLLLPGLREGKLYEYALK